MKVKRSEGQGIAVDSKLFVKLLRPASNIASLYPTDGPCSRVRLSASDGILSLISAIPGVAVRLRLKCSGSSLSPVLVRPKMLMKLLQKDVGSVRIFNDGSKLSVKTDVMMKLSCETDVDFPSLDWCVFEPKNDFQTDGEIFKRAFEYVNLSRSRDMSISRCASIWSNGERLNATDGHRGSTALCPGLTRDIILPPDACHFLEGLLKAETFRTFIFSSEEKRWLITAKAEKGLMLDCNILFDKVEVDLPDLDRVTPREFTSQFTVKAEILKRLLTRFVSLAGDSGVKFEMRSGSLTASFEDQDSIESDIEILPQMNEPGDFAISLNPKYLLDAISFPGTDIVSISIADDHSPAYVQLGSGNTLIMPIRL